ncbi:hypothetical protein [Lignipirellula cremea]|nr:hypothetical protein [Lignipirellula cremea]
MKFARWTFLVAGIYGLLVLLPQYFLETQVAGRPAGLEHPEFFYGFVGVAVAWQIAFLVIALDPLRYRLIMLPAMVEKASFGIAAIALYAAGRLDAATLVAGSIDLVIGLFFVVAFWRVSAAARRLSEL